MECSNFEQQSQAEPSAANEHADERSESHYSMPAVIDTGGQVQVCTIFFMEFSIYFHERFITSSH